MKSPCDFKGDPEGSCPEPTASYLPCFFSLRVNQHSPVHHTLDAYYDLVITELTFDLTLVTHSIRTRSTYRQVGRKIGQC
jgi:hypothetical protein